MYELIRLKCHFIRSITNSIFGRIISGACTFVLFLALPALGQDQMLDLNVSYYDASVKKRVTSKLSFELKSPAERRQVLKDMVWHEKAGGESFLLLRPGVTPEQLDKARSYAREHLSEAMIATLQGRPIMHQSYRDRYLDYIENILMLTGEASDAALLLENYCTHISRKPHGEGVAIVNLVAQIESRLGTLRSGELVKIINDQQPHASRQLWGIEAAVQLHRRGIDMGTEVLLSHLITPPKDEHFGHDEKAAWVLMGMDDPQVLKAMRNMVKTLLSKHGALVDSEGWVAQMAVPAMLHLLTYGNDEDITMLSETTVGLPHLCAIASLYKNPQPAFDFLVEHSFYSNDIVKTISILTMLPEYNQHETLDRLLKFVEKNKPNFKMHIRRQADPFWPTPDISEIYTTFKFGPPWLPMPENLNTFLKSWHGDLREYNPTYESQLAYLEHSFLVERIKAQCGDSWKNVLDSYIMLHGLSTASSPLQYGFLPDGQEFEPFGLKYKDPESNWTGLVVGRVSYDAQWIDDTLQIGIRIYHDGDLVITNTDAAENELKKKFNSYLERDSKELLESIKLVQNNKAVPLEATEKVRDGLFIYKAKPPVRNFAETYLDAQLKFFDQQRLIRFALYRGRAAIDTERGITRATITEAALKAATESSVSLITEYADSLAEMGKVSQAWDEYQRAISKAPFEARNWQLAARMYLERHLYTRAIEILQDAVDQNPDQIVLWKELARALYIAGDYLTCIEATEKILALDPDNTVAIYRQGVCLLLIDEKEKAGELFASLPEGFATEQAGILLYIATKSTKGDEADKSLRALRDNLTNDAPGRELCGILLGENFNFDSAQPRGDTHECKRHFFAGYYSLLSGARDDARRHFEEAIATHRNMLVEYRLAETALRTMEKTQ